METARGKTREEIITKLADRIDVYKKYRRPHSRVTAELAARLAQRLGLAQNDVHAIAEAALLLDIGLHAMTPAYNSSPGPLSFEERLDLWRHSIIGEQQMAKRESTRQAQLLIRWHHEWWNGSGYPDMLAFEDIPIGARILRAVELYSALISDRPYRAALSSDEALEALRSSAGVECDPFIVQALLALLDELHEQQTEQAKEIEPTSDADESPIAQQSPLLPLSEQPAPSEEIPEIERLAGQAIEQQKDLPIEESEWQRANPSQEPPVEQGEQADLEPPPQRFSQWQEAQVSARTDEEAKTRGDEISQEPSAREAGEIALNDKEHDTPSAADSDHNIEAPDMVSAPVSAPRPAPQPVSAPSATQPLPPIEHLLARAAPKRDVESESEKWNGWSRSRYNKKSLLGFEASVLRQIEFRSIAIAFSGWARLDWYLKAWGKLILSNDPRAWAAAAARAMVESKTWLDEESVSQLLEDVYVPGVRLENAGLRRWFGETDAWWLDNLRRNVERISDEALRAQALVLGIQTGDYALSFDDDTLDLKRPLTTIFWRLAGRAHGGPPGHPHNRSYHLPAEEFVKQTRADLLYINLPSAHAELSGSEARNEWRDCWVQGAGASGNGLLDIATVPESKHSYLLMVDRLLREATHIETWAIEYQETGLASARDISEIIKEHRTVRATYSKDLTEVVGGLRNYIIVAERRGSRV